MKDRYVFIGSLLSIAFALHFWDNSLGIVMSLLYSIMPSLVVTASSYFINKKRKGRLRKQTISLGKGRAFLLTPKKNPDV